MNDMPLHEAAINAALEQDWPKAIALNEQIIASDTANTAAMNRLGFAYLKAGKLKEAKRMFTKVRSIDPYNKIAVKNLSKLDTIKTDKKPASEQAASLSPLSFLEDPGKTKVAQCVHLAPQDVLSNLHGGQEVFLRQKNHGIELRDDRHHYIGALPDDIAFKLLRMMDAHNKYQAFVKNVDKNILIVLVREIERGKKFAHQPSFLATTSYQPFAHTPRRVSDTHAAKKDQENDSDDGNE